MNLMWWRDPLASSEWICVDSQDQYRVYARIVPFHERSKTKYAYRTCVKPSRSGCSDTLEAAKAEAVEAVCS
jgi:hypothetical protein